MNKIKELTAHIRRLAEKGYIVDYNTPNELNNALNQIEVVSELMKPTDTWVSIKSEDDLPNDDGIYLIDCEHGVTMAEFSRYGNGNTSWWAVTAIGTYEDSEGAKKVTAWMPLPTHPQTTTTKTVKL